MMLAECYVDIEIESCLFQRKLCQKIKLPTQFIQLMLMLYCEPGLSVYVCVCVLYTSRLQAPYLKVLATTPSVHS